MYERLVTILGSDTANTLMGHLQPQGWAEVATKRDLDQQRELTRRDQQIATEQLRGEMQQGFGELRGEMQQGFGELRGEMQRGFGELRESISENRIEMMRLHRNLAITMMSANGIIAALVVAAVQLT